VTGRYLFACLILLLFVVAGCAFERVDVSTTRSDDAPSSQVAVDEPPEQAAEPVAEPEAAPAPPPPPPPPEPAPFAGRDRVRVDELLAALALEVDTLATSPDIRKDYEVFLTDFELEDSDELYLDYVRIKLAFEATRAGGWWGLTWDITNEEPRSDLVWAHWKSLELGPAPTLASEVPSLPDTTAIAECDELSALFAFVAQRIGLSRSSEVGLLWPTGNHVVAVWTIDAKSDSPMRVVIPTSQIFLDGDQSLGTHSFDPWRQKTIFDYRRQDAKGSLELPGALASAFVLAVREHGMRPQAELQQLRNDREARQWQALRDAE
jgi:hypothetical protein